MDRQSSSQPHDRVRAWELVTSNKEILCSVLRSFFVLVTNIKCLKAKKNGSFAFLISKPIVERRMSSEDLIFTSSSASEDSKVNFNCRLRAGGGRFAKFEQPTDGRDSVKEVEAYTDARADDEWWAIYVEERKTDEKLEKQLQYPINRT